MRGRWIDRLRQRKGIPEIILDLESSLSGTHGQQEGSAYNGYSGCECCHRLFCFNQFGDLERALLRNGNVHGGHDWPSVLEPIVRWYRGPEIRRFLRGDAAFADPRAYRYLEGEAYSYAIRLPGNPVLYPEIEPFLTPPVGRPPNQPVVWYQDFR